MTRTHADSEPEGTITLRPMIASGSIDDTTIDIEPKSVSLDNRVDYRDLVIDEFVTSEARLIERVIEVTLQRDSYAVLAKHAISYGHDVTVERDVLREQHSRLLDEFRHLRARVMSRDLRPETGA
jgi:predicted DNA-binding transcriptional regulator YafY